MRTLQEILDLHREWLNGATKGKQLVWSELTKEEKKLFIGADLTGANLKGANLRGANLEDAKLTNAQRGIIKIVNK
jgi:uncharacterized protein YjbI with pentapeptide repeats